MDEPSAQLQLDLREAVTEALRTRRPVLHHLNADTSWLLQIPRPQAATSRSGRHYYNVLIDPWLSGPQSDVASWFSKQWHATESKVASIAALEELLRSTEVLALGLRLGSGRKSNAEEIQENGEVQSYIDVVAISHEFTDHCHKDTLLEVHPDVPVFAAEKAAALIKSWNHFRSVTATPKFTDKVKDWHATSVPPLPEWVGISRLVSSRDALYYHSAIMIAFNNGDSQTKAQNRLNDQSEKESGSNGSHQGTQATRASIDEDGAEAVVYTPHGIHHESLALLPAAKPQIDTLAFLHGLHDVSIDWGQQLNLGAHNGLKAQRLLNAKYWIGTHDEVKHGGGVVSWFLRRKVYSIGDALEEELTQAKKADRSKAGKKDQAATGVVESFADTNWVHLENGESQVLA